MYCHYLLSNGRLGNQREKRIAIVPCCTASDSTFDPAFFSLEEHVDCQLFNRGMLFNRVIELIPPKPWISPGSDFSQLSRAHVKIRLTIGAKRAVINHPSPRRDVKSKIIYELISALARALTKRVSVCLSCNAMAVSA